MEGMRKKKGPRTTERREQITFSNLKKGHSEEKRGSAVRQIEGRDL